MRNAKYWYVIQYDIKCPKRGQKVLRHLKTCAFALQKSVFAWQGTTIELDALQTKLLQLINPKQDDIRGYLISKQLLLFGANPFLEESYFSGYPPHNHYQVAQISQKQQQLFG